MQRFNHNKNTASNLWNWDFGLSSPACTTPDPSSLPATSTPSSTEDHKKVKTFSSAADLSAPSTLWVFVVSGELCILTGVGQMVRWRLSLYQTSQICWSTQQL